MTDGYIWQVNDADDIKYGVIPPKNWYLVEISKRETGKSKRDGSPLVKFYFRVVSKYPDINNTEINMWLTYSERAMRVGKNHIRGVLGDECIQHGQNISWEKVLSLTEEMEWASFPITGDDIGEKRLMLALVDTQDNPPYDPQNTIKRLKAVSETWEEPDIEGMEEEDTDDDVPLGHEEY